MVTVLVFAFLSLFIVFPILFFSLHLSLWLSIFLTLLSFPFLQFLYVLFFRIVAQTVPTDRPIEKQNRLCHFGTVSMIAALDVYAGVRPVITGIEKIPQDTRFLYVCNHRSMFDPVIVMDRLHKYNISFISKPSNMEMPLIGRVAYAVGFLPIDRDNDRKALKTILTAADYMKRDVCSMGVYPEGTRSKTKELLPFHAGCFKAAQRAKVPIVVACVHGSENVKLLNPFSTATVYLDILEVIPAETVCSMRTDALSEHIRSVIQADLDHAEAEEKP